QQQQQQQPSFLTSDYQQFVQNGDLTRLKDQNELQSLSNSKTATVQQPYHPIVHADDGSSAFRQPQRQQQYLFDQNTKTQDLATTVIETVTRSCGDDISSFAVPSSSSSSSSSSSASSSSSSSSNNSSFVSSLSRSHVISVKQSYHNEKGDGTEPKLIISDIEMTDDCDKTDKESESCPDSEIADRREGQSLSITENRGSEIIGISTYATIGAVIHMDSDEFVEKMDSAEEQPRMKTILNFGEFEFFKLNICVCNPITKNE
ncbi:unnamed protein product, partial [Onchocerca flexuosa]|uniref:Pecanex-like protein n=1 Tax=Onchocerca flexuosa TaxID=387005 RepID=A0A183HX95_9BILA